MNNIRTPKQQRGIETKKRIIKTAFKLFAEKGIHGTNSKEIAKKAKVSIGSFYSYFKNKKTLLLEMLEDYVEQHYRMVWQTLSSLDIEELDSGNVKKIIQGAFKAYDISPEFHRQTHALRYSDPDIKRIYDRERERELDQIRYLMEKNINDFTSINDPKATAMVIHNAVENVAHTAKFIGTDIEEDRLADTLANMISGFILGNNFKKN
jgi:AcrR family transcriptional regulator